MNTCQRKKQSYNHLSNISFSPFYTVSEYNQRRTVKLFDCDLSSSQNQTLQPFSIKGPLEVWSDFFLYTILETLLGPSENVLNVWFCDVCDWYTCGKLNWRDPLGHHPTLWYILQYELWIDFIYTTQETKMLNGNGIFCVWGEMTLTQNKERYNKHQQQLPSFSGLDFSWEIALASFKSEIQQFVFPTLASAQQCLFRILEKYDFIPWTSKDLFSFAFCFPSRSTSFNWQLKSVNTWKMVIYLYIGFVKHWSKVYELF